MADKMKLSMASSEQLSMLSARLDLKRNVVCRIALGVSLSEGEPVQSSIGTDTGGFEFNKSTVLGADETLFRAVASCIQKSALGADFFNIYVRNHIERGLGIMDADYRRVNSPTEYLMSLIPGDADRRHRFCQSGFI